MSGVVKSSGAFGYFRVFNPELAEGIPLDNVLALGTADAWELYRMDLTNPTAMTKVEAEPAPPTLYATTTDGRTFITDIDWAKNQTTLLDLSADPPTREMTGDGLLIGVPRMR